MLAVLVAMLRRLRAVELRLQALQMLLLACCCDRLGARLRRDKQVYVLPCHRPRSTSAGAKASSGGLPKLRSMAGTVACTAQQNPTQPALINRAAIYATVALLTLQQEGRQ